MSKRTYRKNITLPLEAYYAGNRKWDIYRGSEAEMAKTRVELGRRHEYRGGSGHFDEYQPMKTPCKNPKKVLKTDMDVHF